MSDKVKDNTGNLIVNGKVYLGYKQSELSQCFFLYCPECNGEKFTISQRLDRDQDGVAIVCCLDCEEQLDLEDLIFSNDEVETALYKK